MFHASFDDRFQAELGWNWIISAFGWLFKKKSITVHGNMNIKCIAFKITLLTHIVLQSNIENTME